MKPRMIVAVPLLLSLVVPVTLLFADNAADPRRMWERLSPDQQAAVRETLSRQLPQVLPEEANEYAQTLAAEVARWSQLAEELEQGRYGGMIGAFEGELSGFVRDYLDEQLPEEGFTRWLFEQVDADAELFRKIAIELADPDKGWEDVKAALFSEVNQKVQATSEETLKNVVVDAINEIIGTADFKGYTSGELYVLAVGEWTDFVRTWPELFEREAANELYEIYRKNRQQFGQASAETTITDLWVLERVPDRKDQTRRIRSWSARLTHLSDKLHVQFDDLPDMLCTLFDQYWSTARGQDPWVESWDTGFHGWLTERIQAEVRDARQELRRQAREEFERARLESQRKLAEIHRTAAQELHKAIEAELTDQQRAAREAAIREATVLLDLMWRQNVQPGLPECAEFTSLAQALGAIRARASSAQTIFHNGVSDDVESIQQRIDGLRVLVDRLESGLGAVRAKSGEAEVLVAAVEQAAVRACQAAGRVGAAPSKDDAREHMISAAQESKAVERMIDKAHERVFESSMLRKRLLESMRAVDYRDLEDLRKIRAELHEIDLAVKALQEYEQLRAQWDNLYGRLRASEKRQRVILDAFRAKEARILTLLSPYLPEAQIDKIRAAVADYRDKLACLAANLEAWDRQWAEDVFPAVDLPSLQELRRVQDLLASYPHLFQLAVEKFEPLRAGIERLEQQADQLSDRLSDAQSRANLCAAKGIVDYDRAWVKSDLIRQADPDVSREPDQPPDYGADIQDAPALDAPKADQPPDYGTGLQDAPRQDAPKPVLPPDYGADLQDAPRQDAPRQDAPKPVRPPDGTDLPDVSRPDAPRPVRPPDDRVDLPDLSRPDAPLGRDPATQLPAEGVVIREPLYAIYGIHPWRVPVLPRHIQQMVASRDFQLDAYAAAATAWINGLGLKDVVPAEQPTSFLAYRVSGDLLADYARHVHAGATQGNRGDRADYWLFQERGRYHQVVRMSAPENLEFQAPLFLSFEALFMGEPPARFRQTEFSLLGTSIQFQRTLTLSDRQTLGGGWSLQDQNRVTYQAGPIETDLASQWKESTHRLALEHARKVLHTGIQAAVGLQSAWGDPRR